MSTPPHAVESRGWRMAFHCRTLCGIRCLMPRVYIYRERIGRFRLLMRVLWRLLLLPLDVTFALLDSLVSRLRRRNRPLS